MALTILTVVIGLPISRWISSRPIEHPSGVLIKGEPVQTTADLVQLNNVAGYTLTQLAGYHLHARVLGVKYYNDNQSDLAPLDLAVGWGRMSDSSILKDLTISLSNRFYFYEYGITALSETEVRNSSSNNHIIPADRKIAGFMRSLRVGSLIDLRGFLVCAKKDEFRWSSSLSRTDSEKGACELFYVTQASLINGDESYIDPEDHDNLRHWYDLLYTWRQSLDLKNYQEVRDFNREAQLYMKTAFPERTLPPSPYAGSKISD